MKHTASSKRTIEGLRPCGMFLRSQVPKVSIQCAPCKPEKDSYPFLIPLQGINPIAGGPISCLAPYFERDKPFIDLYGRLCPCPEGKNPIEGLVCTMKVPSDFQYPESC